MTPRSRRALGLLLLAAACGPKGEPTPPAVTLLTPEGRHQQGSRWSPDGTRVAYWTQGTTGWELRVAQADLSGERVLAADREPFNPILWSPDGKLIAFSSDAASFQDVWVVPTDSGAPRRLTTAPGVEYPIQWSPDGRRLSYGASEEGGAIRTNVYDLATGSSTPLLAERRSAYGIWSPDGKSIAYVVSEGSKSTIWLADSAGGNGKQLTTEGLENFDGTGSPWSPDGAELLYISRRTGTGDIWALPVKGGAPRQLTHDVRDDSQPVWSADGKWIAFVSDRGRQTDVWLMPAAGGSEIRITDDDVGEGMLQWVGNSHRLAFQTGQNRSTLSLINVADGSERQLTPDSIRADVFDISPDGKEVVFGAEAGGGVSNVMVQSIAGGAARALVSDGNNNGDPYWSPDGREVLFVSSRTGNLDIFVVDSAGGAPRALTSWPSDEVDAEWSSDSKWVYFLSGREGGAFFDVYRVAPTGGTPERVTKTGNVTNIEPSRGSPDVYITGLGGKAGQFSLSRVLPDGKMQTLWDKSNVQGLSHRRISPTGDSLAVQVEQPGGGFASVIISVKSGASRPILGKEETAGPWSPDGKQILYYFGSPTSDLGILNLADGTTRRLTNTPTAEGTAQWTPDSKSVLVQRSEPRRRIATVDVGGLLPK